MLRPSKFRHRAAIILFILSAIFVISLFAAPATIEPGTVKGLNGRANAMDYQDIWKDLSPFHTVIYTFGDINCHQIQERTIMINGNQMPVCARDVGVFMGFMLGAILMIRAVATDNPTDPLISILPSRIRRMKFVRLHPGYTVIVILLMLIVPTGIDGTVQLISYVSGLPFGLSYESTNPTRLLTGFPMGASVGILITMLFMTLFSRRENGEQPLLPMFVKAKLG
ncbi:MAG: DUF2085 domain-containing protein [Thermoplasmatota archaeon]